MSNEQTPTTLYRRIVLPSPASALVLQPLGDIHYNSPHCAKDVFLADLKDMRKRHDPRTHYYLFMGDESELCSTRERENLADRSMHATTLTRMDQNALQDHQDLLRRLAFMGDNIIGWIQGNHFWEFQSGSLDHGVQRGMTSTQWMARQTRSKWLGFLSYIRLSIRFENTTKGAYLDVVACHGKAGGKLVGTSINQIDDLRQVFPGADIYLFGHDHKRGGWPTTVLQVPTTNARRTDRADELTIRHRDQYMCRTGSYHRAYVPNEPGYPVAKLLRPSSLGSVRLHIRFKEDADGNLHLKLECVS